MFFGKLKNAEFVILPSCCNIYDLYKDIKNDDDLDIITLIVEKYNYYQRQQDSKSRKKVERINGFGSDEYSLLNRKHFSEIYLFYDYDAHQNNTQIDEDRNVVIENMCSVFDNETENGLLFISYPMVEAMRDFQDTHTFPKVNYIQIYKGSHYKSIIAERSKRYQNLNNYDQNIWNYVLTLFLMKLSIIFGKEDVIDFHDVKKYPTQKIYHQIYQKYDQKYNIVPILSGFSEFVLLYFKEEFIEKNIQFDQLLLERFYMYKKQCQDEMEKYK